MIMKREQLEDAAPAIRAVLAETAPYERRVFDAEFGDALARACAEFDLAPLEDVVARWRPIADLRAQPPLFPVPTV